MRLQSISPRDLTPELVQAFASRNALLAAGDRETCNTMTIGWCQIGRLWNLPVCTVYVRPERYTYAFMESQDFFTVSVLPEERNEVLGLCGTKSGRDTDKISGCGLTVQYGAGDAPFFGEAACVLVCRKLYAQDLTAQAVTAGEQVLPFYGEKGGWHKMYVGQIIEAYQK